MNFSAAMRNLRSRQFWFSWIGVAFGTLILAAGFVLFTNPYKIIPGGVYGLGRVLHHLVPSIQTGTFGLMLDIPLMITGFIVFGSSFGAKTIFAALLTPVFMNTMTDLLGENPNDGTSFISVFMNLSDNLLVASIFGGLLIGAGVGLIVKFGATSGGTDIVAMLLGKYFKMKFSSAVFITETTVVLLGMLILQDWKLPLYSLVAIFVQSKAIDFVLEGANYDKLLFIISEKKAELKEYILSELGRGGTIIKSKGMYTDTEREMMFVVVSLKQISTVKDKIKIIDPDAFFVVVDAQETYGDGFKPLVDSNL